MAYFRAQNVGIRVISGDNPLTVSAVATELDIPNADHFIDMRSVEQIGDIPSDTVVFGRVLPEQKRDLVNFLKAQGHVVAMTGDGVNDIPSLKAADIGIAMDTATPATKSISQLVLLDGRFDRLPGVVGEGRRVIANMERVSSLFVTKTVYAALLALAVGVFRVPFPFLPRHLSLIATFTIGLPAFVLSFRSSNEPCQPGYLTRVMHFAVPAGIFAAATTFSTYSIVRSSLVGATLSEARTAATLALTLAGLFILHRLIRPVGWREVVLLATMLGAFAVNLVPSPLADFYALELPELKTSAIVVGVLAALIVVLEAALTTLDRIRGLP
jgi:cation-transporting ATPase E